MQVLVGQEIKRWCYKRDSKELFEFIPIHRKSNVFCFVEVFRNLPGFESVDRAERNKEDDENE